MHNVVREINCILLGGWYKDSVVFYWIFMPIDRLLNTNYLHCVLLYIGFRFLAEVCMSQRISWLWLRPVSAAYSLDGDRKPVTECGTTQMTTKACHDRCSVLEIDRNDDSIRNNSLCIRFSRSKLKFKSSSW